MQLTHSNPECYEFINRKVFKECFAWGDLNKITFWPYRHQAPVWSHQRVTWRNNEFSEHTFRAWMRGCLQESEWSRKHHKRVWPQWGSLCRPCPTRIFIIWFLKPSVHTIILNFHDFSCHETLKHSRAFFLSPVNYLRHLTPQKWFPLL